MKWNKNAASQKGRVFRSGLLSTAMLAAGYSAVQRDTFYTMQLFLQTGKQKG